MARANLSLRKPSANLEPISSQCAAPLRAAPAAPGDQNAESGNSMIAPLPAMTVANSAPLLGSTRRT